MQDEATFKSGIRNRRDKIPGTGMGFAGIKDRQEIDAYWTCISSFAASGNKEVNGGSAHPGCQNDLSNGWVEWSKWPNGMPRRRNARRPFCFARRAFCVPRLTFPDLVLLQPIC